MNESNKISIVGAPDPEPSAVPIKLDEKAIKKLKKAKQAERVAEAHAMQLVGAKILKIKTSVYAKIGAQIEKLGVKHLGYGYLASANDNADNALAECDKLIAEFTSNNPGTDPDVIVALMQLKLGFNRQIIEVGDSHIRADRMAVPATTGNNLMMPFPPGQSVTVSVNPPAQKAIENGKPTE